MSAVVLQERFVSRRKCLEDLVSFRLGRRLVVAGAVSL